MANRCGCGTNCACVVTGGQGITVSGTGDRTRPYRIVFDGGEVVGDGMQWNATTNDLETKIVPGGGLAYNAAGALYTTGEGGGNGNPEQIPATVAALEARADNQNVVAGTFGAGHLIKPDTTRGSLEYGTRRGVDALHVPMSFLRDGTPVATSVDTVFGEPVQEQDHNRWRVIPQLPGVWPPNTPNPPTVEDTYAGWFGYLEPNEYGLLTAAEAFEIVNRDVVMIIELNFPPIEAGGWATPTPDDRVVGFLSDLVRLVRRYAAQRSIIVTSRTPEVPREASTQKRDVLRPFYDASVTAVGPALSTPEVAAAVPPDDARWSWWRWCLLGTALDTATMQSYTNLPDTFGLVFPVHRQRDHEQVVVPSGAAGVVSGDPDYYAGGLPNHPRRGDYRYRKADPTLWYSTVRNGLYGPVLDPTEVSARIRGWMPPAPSGSGEFVLGPDSFQQGGVTHFVLQGDVCPLPDAVNYQLSWAMDLRPPAGGAVNANTLRAELAFAVESDHALTRWEDAPDTSGYIVSFATWDQDRSKWAYVYMWDPAANGGAGGTVERAAWDISDVNAGAVGFRVRVNETRVEFAVTGRDDPNVEIRPVHTEPATGSGALPGGRGGYVYFGRQAPAGFEPVRAVLSRWDYRPGQGNDPALMQRVAGWFQ